MASRNLAETDDVLHWPCMAKKKITLEQKIDALTSIIEKGFAATPETKVYKIGAILEAFKYRRPPFTPRPKALDF